MKNAALILSLAMLVAPTASLAGTATASGHVIKVEQQVRTANDGEAMRLTIRTHQGEEMQLHLGGMGSCDDCLRLGDRVRARLAAETGTSGERRVEWMRVRRDGRQFNYIDRGAGMVRVHPGPAGGHSAQRGSARGGGSGGNRGRGGG